MSLLIKHLSKNYILQSFLFLICIVLYTSCGDDDENQLTVVPERDRAEQQEEDNQLLINYFEAHYYNATALQELSNISISDIVIDSIPSSGQVPEGGKSLIDELYNETNNPSGKLRTYTINVFDVDYKYYVLTFNEGGGTNPNPTDDVFVKYEGFLEDSTRFETTNFVVPGILDLTSLVNGWRLAIPKFKTAESFTSDNGEVIYNNPGVGIMFLPSGLGFFSQARVNIPAYSNIIFSFELYRSEGNDHDNDGVPSYLEDLNNNSDLGDDDTDGNTFPNFFDADDDGDGVLTINENITTVYRVDTNVFENEPVLGANEYEISRSEENGVINITTTTLIDADNSGEFDYLEANIANDNSDDNS